MRAAHLKPLLLSLAALCLSVKAATEPLTKEEKADVQKKLEAFEKGTVELREITDQENNRKKIISYYLSSTNTAPVKLKLLASWCFAIEEQLPQAAKLGEEYVSICSNDLRGWRIVGAVHFKTKSWAKAVWAYTNAVMLGGEDCYMPLGYAALAAERLDLVRDIVPHLLILKESRQTDQTDKLDIVAVLTTYSLKTRQPEIFLKAIKGMEIKELLSRDDLAMTVRLGLEEFGTKLAPGTEPAEPSKQEETAKVKRLLQAFENELIGLPELTDGEKERKQILGYYLSDTNAIPTKAKLVVSRCLALEGQFPQAAKLAEEYMASYSNDWRAWRILGGAHFATKSYGKAVWAYTNAVMLGDEKCFAPLAAAALATDRVDLVRDILPHLLILKQASRTEQYDKLSIVAILTTYSLKTHQQEVFLKALQGVEIKDILSRDDVARTVSLGCEEFSSTEVEAICSKLKEAIGKKTE